MTEKIRVSREAAEAIEELHSRGYQNAEIIANWWMGKDDGLGGVINANIFDGDELINALTVGYEVEETPEEKWSKRYKLAKEIAMDELLSSEEGGQFETEKSIIEEMARDFGLKIEGVDVN